MNEVLELAQQVLEVLADSNQSLEGKSVAIEIVRTLQKGDPYGMLALPTLALARSSANSIPSHSTERSEPQTRSGE